MKERGITTGTSRTEFSPDGVVTSPSSPPCGGSPVNPPSSQATSSRTSNSSASTPTRWRDEPVRHHTGTSPPPDRCRRDTRSTRHVPVARAGKPEAFTESATLPEKMRSQPRPVLVEHASLKIETPADGLIDALRCGHRHPHDLRPALLSDEHSHCRTTFGGLFSD